MGRQYRQFKTIQIAARLLPRSVMYRIGDAVAQLYFKWDARARSAVAGNLRRIYAVNKRRPAAPEINRLALAVFRGLAWNFIDFFHFIRIAPGARRRLFTTAGLHHLDDALALGKGVIMTSGHLGAFEMGALIVTAKRLSPQPDRPAVGRSACQLPFRAATDASRRRCHSPWQCSGGKPACLAQGRHCRDPRRYRLHPA